MGPFLKFFPRNWEPVFKGSKIQKGGWGACRGPCLIVSLRCVRSQQLAVLNPTEMLQRRALWLHTRYAGRQVAAALLQAISQVVRALGFAQWCFVPADCSLSHDRRSRPR
jgi:hypothetical protein